MNEIKIIETGPSLKHWPRCLCAGAVLAATGLALFVFFRFSLAASALPALAGSALLAWPALAAGNTQYVVTNRRAFRREGLFSKKTWELPISLVRDVRVRREGLAAALGVGDVELESAAGRLLFAGVEDPDEMRAKILSLR